MPSPLNGLNIVTVDFETYFDGDYNLRKQGIETSTYVRDERFEVLCVGIRTARAKQAKAVPGHRAATELNCIDWSKTALLGHHTHFDGLILAHHFGIKPRYYLDTLSMGRALHGNDIPGDLDSVAKHWGHGGKSVDVLPKVKGMRRGDIPKELFDELLYYCANDVDITADVFRDMMRHGYPDDELDIIDNTVSLFTEPVTDIDRELAQSELERERAKRDELFRKVYQEHTAVREAVDAKLNENRERETAGKKLRKDDIDSVPELVAKNLNSKDKLAELFSAMGVEPPVKPSPTHPDQRVYAFAKNDLDFQALRAHSDPQVRELAEARILASSNIGEERAIKLLERSESGMRFPVYLRYCGAHTMRWSGGDGVNMQNFPVEGRKGAESKLRKCFMAPPGMQMVAVDSAQIEARVNAWFCGQESLLQALADPNREPYCEFSSELYNRTITKSDTEERHVGKTSVLGLGFGMGPDKFQLTLATGAMGPPVYLSYEMCQKAVNLFRTENPYIQLRWQQLQKLIQACLMQGQVKTLASVVTLMKGRIEMPNGLALHYPGLRMEPDEENRGMNYVYHKRGNPKSKLYGGLLDENCVQCLARIILGEQALEIAKHYRIVTLTHDEVVFIAPTNKAKKALEFATDVMRISPEWAPELPLDAEGGYAKRYGEIEK